MSPEHKEGEFLGCAAGFRLFRAFGFQFIEPEAWQKYDLYLSDARIFFADEPPKIEEAELSYLIGEIISDGIPRLAFEPVVCNFLILISTKTRLALLLKT